MFRFDCYVCGGLEAAFGECYPRRKNEQENNARTEFVKKNLQSSYRYRVPFEEQANENFFLFDEQNTTYRKTARSTSKSPEREKRREDVRERYRSMTKSCLNNGDKRTMNMRLSKEEDEIKNAHDTNGAVVFKESLVLEMMKSHFPGAGPSDAILQQCIALLADYSITPDNTLYAQSICPDEINHEKGDITDIFSEYLGEVFHLGGLAGIPFTGKTGFSAFSHHVPDGGNLFILFAPHIGIAHNYKLGQYCREGQDHPGAACGASVGALAFCARDSQAICMTEEFLAENKHDYQMHFITQEIYKRKDIIFGRSTENEQMEELTMQVYNIGREFLEQIVSTDFCHSPGHGGHQWAGKLILLGGIQINMPHPMSDCFLPLMFQVRQEGQAAIDLLDGLKYGALKKPV